MMVSSGTYGRLEKLSSTKVNEFLAQGEHLIMLTVSKEHTYIERIDVEKED